VTKALVKSPIRAAVEDDAAVESAGAVGDGRVRLHIRKNVAADRPLFCYTFISPLCSVGGSFTGIWDWDFH